MTEPGAKFSKTELFSQICKKLPPDFEQLENPEHMFHFWVKASVEVMEELYNLSGEYILVDAQKTLFELLQDSKN